VCEKFTYGFPPFIIIEKKFQIKKKIQTYTARFKIKEDSNIIIITSKNKIIVKEKEVYDEIILKRKKKQK